MKHTAAVIAMIALCGGQDVSSAGVASGTILKITPYEYPDPTKLTQSQDRNLANYYTREEYERAMAPVRAGTHELLDAWYLSDGLEVRAYVYRPRPLPASKLPAIIYNRGSGPMDDQGFVFAPFFHRLATAGFVVIAPQYRGGAGAGGRDEIGGADLAEVTNAITLAGNLGYVDVANLFMYGESRGGMMTFQAIRDRVPIRAAATFGAFTDFQALLATMPSDLPAKTFSDWERRKSEIVERRSAIRWADRLEVPLLLMHGGADPQVSPLHSLNLAVRLQELSRPYELVIYYGDGHILKENQVDRDARATGWFREHLGK